LATILRDPERPEELGRLKRWLLQPQAAAPGRVQGPHRWPSEHHQQPWWKVMCLTGVDSATVGNTIAAVLLHIRDRTGKLPHVYFGWTEGNPLAHLVRYLVFGDGDVPPITREVLRKAEPDRDRRPLVHVG
jgi:hypothetical protein